AMARKRALAALALGVWSAGFVSPVGPSRAVSSQARSTPRRLSARVGTAGGAACLAAFGLSAALVL
ncbi:unnamed protein product, partial [Symbiodinium pilosum]